MNNADLTVAEQLGKGDWMLLGYLHCKRSKQPNHVDPVVEQLWGRLKMYGEESRPLDFNPRRFLRSKQTIVPATELPRYRIGDLFRAGEGRGVIGSVRTTIHRFDKIDLTAARILRGYTCKNLVQVDAYSGFDQLKQTFFTISTGCADNKGNRVTLLFPSSVIFCSFYTSSHNLVAALFRDRLASDNYNEFWDPSKSGWVDEDEGRYFVRLERGMLDADFWLIAHFAAHKRYWRGAQSLAQSLQGGMTQGAPPQTLFPCEVLPNCQLRCLTVGTRNDEPVLLVLDIQHCDLINAFPRPIRYVEFERDNPGGDGSSRQSPEKMEKIERQELQRSEHDFSPSVDAVPDPKRFPSEIIDQKYACFFALQNQNRGVKRASESAGRNNDRAAYVTPAEELKESSLDTGTQAGGAHPLRIVSKPSPTEIKSPNLTLIREALKLLEARGVSSYWLPDGAENSGYNLKQRLGDYPDFNVQAVSSWLKSNKRSPTTRNVYVCELRVDGTTSYLFEIEQRLPSESFCAFLYIGVDPQTSDALIDRILGRIVSACGVASDIIKEEGRLLHPIKHTTQLATRIEQLIRPAPINLSKGQ